MLLIPLDKKGFRYTNLSTGLCEYVIGTKELLQKEGPQSDNRSGNAFARLGSVEPEC